MQKPSIVKCSKCGRFLGYEAITKGYILLKCKNCKNWTICVGSMTNVNRVQKIAEELLQSLEEKGKKGDKKDK